MAKKQTNPEIWEAIKAAAEQSGKDPYKMLMQMIKDQSSKPKKPNPDNLLICCICQDPIKPESNGWARGNNAEPVVENGRCCNDCNWSVVLPTRMAKMRDSIKIKQ